MELSTIGRIFLKDYHLQMRCIIDLDIIPDIAEEQVYGIIFIKAGYGFLKSKVSSIFVASPAVCCFNENEKPQIVDGSNLKLDIIYFQPWVINSTFNYENVRDVGCIDKWLITPFVERLEKYSGVISINQEIANYIAQLVRPLSNELETQIDGNWPCRSRSYLLELLLLLWKSYINYNSLNQPILEEISQESKQLIEYLHTNYQNKITIADMTKIFHVNRTTLNSNFKKLTNTSIMDYLNKYRIEIASAMLRNTVLPINEVKLRVGFVDDAHFWRTFKKYINCSPSEYRQQSCWMLQKIV